MNVFRSVLIGVHRNCTFLKNTIPLGPQYSIEFGKTSGSINGLQLCPTPKWPSSPHACRSRNVVCPASTPVPKSSNSKIVFRSPNEVGVDDLTPNLVCRTLKKACPFGPNSFAKAGNFVGRTTSNQFGSIAPKL